MINSNTFLLETHTYIDCTKSFVYMLFRYVKHTYIKGLLPKF